MPQIYDMEPTALLPLRRKACWESFHPKIPKASAGFEPANLGTKSQHATPRPQKILENKKLVHGVQSCAMMYVQDTRSELLSELWVTLQATN